MAFEIVLAEALNNIVEHSYREQPSGWIVAEAERVGEWVVCRLTDAGCAMPGDTMPPAHPAPDTRPAALPEGGFGWQMIRDLAHHVTYAREDGVNRLLFALPIDGGTPLDPDGDR
jgi:serine/threonine-protein kinase RsbW